MWMDGKVATSMRPDRFFLAFLCGVTDIGFYEVN
jgi:hypothetical protein